MEMYGSQLEIKDFEVICSNKSKDSLIFSTLNDRLRQALP